MNWPLYILLAAASLIVAGVFLFIMWKETHGKSWQDEVDEWRVK